MIGWDLLLRALVEIDLQAARVFVRDPATTRVPESERVPLFLHWKVPYLLGSFSGGPPGPFMYDTGAG